MYKKTFTAIVIILILSLTGTGFAGTKFINKDTAKDRKPIKFGTRTEKSDIIIKSDDKSNIISVEPQKDENPEEQQVGPIFVVPEIKP